MSEGEWQNWLDDVLRSGGIVSVPSLPGIARKVFRKVEDIRNTAFQSAYDEGYRNGRDDGFEEALCLREG